MAGVRPSREAPGEHLLYDGDCCFCEGFARWVERRSGGRVEAVPFADRRAAGWVPDRDRLLASFHLVGREAGVLSGPAALPALAERTLGRPARALLERLPRPWLEGAYRWVKERRW